MTGPSARLSQFPCRAVLFDFGGTLMPSRCIDEAFREAAPAVLPNVAESPAGNRRSDWSERFAMGALGTRLDLGGESAWPFIHGKG